MIIFDHEKLDVYRMAKRSATECAAIIDVCQHLQLIKVYEVSDVHGRWIIIT